MKFLSISCKIVLNLCIFVKYSLEQEGTTSSPLGTTTSSSFHSNASNAEFCKINGNCCLMYAWLGNEALFEEREDGAVPPTICDDLNDEQRDENPCFGPLVYSDSLQEIRPKPSAVIDYCEDNEIACFCVPQSDEACIKLSYLSEQGKPITESRYCGRIIDVDSTSTVKSGCYEDAVEGRIRELCACDPGNSGNYCNNAITLIFPIQFITLSFILLILKILHD